MPSVMSPNVSSIRSFSEVAVHILNLKDMFHYQLIIRMIHNFLHLYLNIYFPQSSYIVYLSIISIYSYNFLLFQLHLQVKFVKNHLKTMVFIPNDFILLHLSLRLRSGASIS
jgi:hypothetical protein